MRVVAGAGHARAGGRISAGMISVVQDAVAHAGGDRAERLAAALRAFAGIADDLDDVLLERDARLRTGLGAGAFASARAGLPRCCRCRMSGCSKIAVELEWCGKRPGGRSRPDVSVRRND